VNVTSDGIDVMSLTAHKLYGPKGVGALYVRRRNPRVQITAQMDGGGHERGMRSGTLNVPGIVGLGAACEIGRLEMAQESKRLSFLRDKLKDKLFRELDEVYVNGSMEHRLPHNLNDSFAYVEGESLLMGINDIASQADPPAPRRRSSRVMCSRPLERAMTWLIPPSGSASAASIRKRKLTMSATRLSTW
jgi:cysteine desulfurase